MKSFGSWQQHQSVSWEIWKSNLWNKKKVFFLRLILCFCDIKGHIFDTFFRTEFAKPYLLRFNKWYCFLELRLVHGIRSFLLNALLKEKRYYFKNAGFLRFFLKAFILPNSELSKIPFNFKRMDLHKKCLYLWTNFS